MRLVIILLTLLTISCIKRPTNCTLQPSAQVEIEQKKIHPTATINCSF